MAETFWAPTELSDLDEFEYIKETITSLYDYPVRIHHPSDVLDILIATGLSDYGYELDTIKVDQYFSILIKSETQSPLKINCHSLAVGFCYTYRLLGELNAKNNC